MSLERLRPVMWNGELVALAGAERFHIIAPRLRGDDASDADVAYVALLCLYHQQVLLGELPDSRNPAMAERWADLILEIGEQSDDL